MKLRVLLVTVVISLAASGCALFRGSSCESGYRFPERFDALQVIRVEQQGEQHQFLASVRRTGEDFELAMLDPIFQRPLVEASFVGGEYRERRSLPPEAKLDARALFESIRQLFTARCLERVEGGLRLTGSRFVYEFEEPAAGPCAFPREIRQRARGGFDLTVVAATEEVVCEPLAPPVSR
jgi:hypothetical protein